MALELNDDLEEYCATGPSVSDRSLKRLYGFGLLPLVPATEISAVLDAVKHISKLPHLKGLIMGTRGLGNGLDDDALDPVWAGSYFFSQKHKCILNYPFQPSKMQALSYSSILIMALTTAPGELKTTDTFFLLLLDFHSKQQWSVY